MVSTAQMDPNHENGTKLVMCLWDNEGTSAVGLYIVYSGA